MVFQPSDTSAELRIHLSDDSLEVEEAKDVLVALSISTSSVHLGVSAGSVDSVTVSILNE